MVFNPEELEVFSSGTEVFLAILDIDGKVLKANDKWCSKLKLEEEEFIGQSISTFIHSSDREKFYEILSELASTGQVCHYLVQFIDKELKSYTFQFDITFQTDKIYLVGFDVTDHYQEHQSLVEMSSIAKVGAWYHDPIRNQNYWSEECYRIHDLEPKDEVSAEIALDFYLPEYRKEIDVLIEKLYEEGQPYDFTGMIKTARGKKKWIRTQAIPTIHDGKLIFIYGITADQTRLYENIKKIEHEVETRELALKGIKSALFDYDVERDLMFINEDFKEMLGLETGKNRLSTEELISHIHPDDKKPTFDRIQQDLQSRGNYHFNEYRVKLKNGEYQYYEVYGWIKRDEDGMAHRVIGNLINVHDRVMISNERNRILSSLEAMVNNGFIYSMLLDIEGYILIADQRTLDIINHDYNVNPAVEKVRYLDVMPDIFKKSFTEEFENACKGKTIRKEVERPKLDGSMQWLDVMYRPIKNENGEIAFVLTNLMDVTGRKKSELSTKEAERKAVELSRLKSEVLSSLSHEVRTPLNGIMGTNEILSREVSNQEHKKLLEAQRESSMRLLKSLTDMIVMSDRETISDGMKRQKIKANRVLRNSYEMYVHMARMKGLEFSFVVSEDDPTIHVDRELFLTCIGSLVNNALKYTDTGEVVLSCLYHTKNASLTISVKDSGIGIHPKELGKIFDDDELSYHKKFEDTGLRLGASKKFLELMEVTLRVVSELDKGTEMILTMPAEL